MGDAAEIIARNKEHFDSHHAHSYDNPTSIQLGLQISRRILTHNLPEKPEKSTVKLNDSFNDGDDSPDDDDDDDLDVNPFWKSASVFDFACGTGLISQHLSPYIRRVVGADLAPLMVDVYRSKVQNQGIPESEMWAYSVDLLGETSGIHGDVSAIHEFVKTHSDEGKGFDAAVCSAAYHHFPDIDRASKVLFESLRKGGYLFIAEFVRASNIVNRNREHMSESEKVHGVAHRGGFTRAELIESLEKVGFEKVDAGVEFRVKMWGSPDLLPMFGQTLEGSETREKNGKKEYLVKAKMCLVVGKKP